MVRMHEKFYSKVQCKAIDLMTKGLITKPLVLPWNEQNLYFSINSGSFYIVPKESYFLKESYIESVSSVYPNIKDREFMKQVVQTGDYYRVNLTGHIKTVGVQNVKLVEVLDKLKTEWYSLELIDAFPKQRVYLKTSETGPLFVACTLKVLLGGVYPVKMLEEDQNEN